MVARESATSAMGARDVQWCERGIESTMVVGEAEEARRKPKTREVGYLAVWRMSFLYARGEILVDEIEDMACEKILLMCDAKKDKG